MTKYLLHDQEENHYDDSDFFAIFFDTETGKIGREMYGTTRGVSPRVAPHDVYLREIPAEVRAQVREILFRKCSEMIREADRREIDEPGSVRIGEAVTLLASGTFKDKRSGNNVEYSEGESGVVIWEGAFGTFYRNGYNRKGRSNTRVGIRLEDGRVVFVKLDICKLSRPYLSEQEIEERANRFADRGDARAIFLPPSYLM